MTSLRISVLGPPRIERDGASIAFDTRKATGLLAVLAVRAEAQSRESLAALLWPEHDTSHAAGALRRTLSVTRAGTGATALVLSGRSVALHPATWTDVGRLRAILTAVARHHADGEPTCDRCLRRVARVPTLVRGRFLEGFGLRDSPEFDDWVASTAETLDLEVAEALDRLADGLAARGRIPAALAAARRRLALDPLHEGTHRRLIALHAAAGDRAGAIARYRECVRILDEELGVAPMPETTELYHRIAAGSAQDPVAPASPSAPGDEPAQPGHLPLAGRREELAALVRAWHGNGGGRVVLLEGEAGIGKTRLADELISVVRAAGGRVLRLAAHEGEQGIPYAPVVAALEEAMRPASASGWLDRLPAWVRGELARALPGMAASQVGAQAPIEGPGAEIRFMEALSRTMLAATAGKAPGLLLLDDGQWCDAATIGVLAYAARRLDEARCCLVIARRPAEPGDDRLGNLARDARRARRLVEIQPRRLSREEVARLAASAGVDLDPGLLFAETEGIPFFVAEYLAAAREMGVGSQGPIDTTTGIRDLLAARIGGLSEGARQVLVAAAVIGRSFDLEVLRPVCGRSPREVAGALDELLARGLLREARGPDGTPVYDFDHAKTREMAYASASLARRRLLHRRAALALQRPTPRGERRGRAAASAIARHLREAGDDPGAARYLRIAGDEAAAVYAHAEALELYRAALGLDPARSAGLHERIGDLATLLGRYDEAVSAYETAAATVVPADGWRIEHRLAALHGRRGEWAIADAHLETALAGVPHGDPAARARLTADRSLVAHRLGIPRVATRLATAALRLADEAADPACRAQAHNLLGILARDAGRLPTARAHLAESLALAADAGLEEARIASLNNLGLLAIAAREPDRGVELARAALDAALTIGDRHREAALRNNLADALHAAGRRAEALDELKQAVAIFAEVGRPGAMEPEIWKLVDW